MIADLFGGLFRLEVRFERYYSFGPGARRQIHEEIFWLCSLYEFHQATIISTACQSRILPEATLNRRTKLHLIPPKGTLTLHHRRRRRIFHNLYLDLALHLRRPAPQSQIHHSEPLLGQLSRLRLQLASHGGESDDKATVAELGLGELVLAILDVLVQDA